ncbi:Transcriptional regulator [Seminavis robusta]|uniref:Transcriptional regulator n=1 Tax=Seminavis robusta TaxID=568900 RepID=A0A9N8D942_9STRA|nr:Transcriptional regulator [Seminavis robusta]|eukprot:Sro2_g001660.1 Transcriptional regulator (661) ;mRNA; f:219260-221427
MSGPQYQYPPNHHGRPYIQVNDHDVLCGRGVNIASHPGNERFRALVQTRHDENYCTLYTTTEKRAVAEQILKHIKSLDPPGRFLKRVGRAPTSRGLNGPWEQLSDREAIKKTCQALRDSNRTDRTGYAAAVAVPDDVRMHASSRVASGLSNKEQAARAAAAKIKADGSTATTAGVPIPSPRAPHPTTITLPVAPGPLPMPPYHSGVPGVVPVPMSLPIPMGIPMPMPPDLSTTTQSYAIPPGVPLPPPPPQPTHHHHHHPIHPPPTASHPSHRLAHLPVAPHSATAPSPHPPAIHRHHPPPLPPVVLTLHAPHPAYHQHHAPHHHQVLIAPHPPPAPPNVRASLVLSHPPPQPKAQGKAAQPQPQLKPPPQRTSPVEPAVRASAPARVHAPPPAGNAKPPPVQIQPMPPPPRQPPPHPPMPTEESLKRSRSSFESDQASLSGEEAAEWSKKPKAVDSKMPAPPPAATRTISVPNPIDTSIAAHAPIGHTITPSSTGGSAAGYLSEGLLSSYDLGMPARTPSQETSTTTGTTPTTEGTASTRAQRLSLSPASAMPPSPSLAYDPHRAGAVNPRLYSHDFGTPPTPTLSELHHPYGYHPFMQHHDHAGLAPADPNKQPFPSANAFLEHQQLQEAASYYGTAPEEGVEFSTTPAPFPPDESLL